MKSIHSTTVSDPFSAMYNTVMYGCIHALLLLTSTTTCYSSNYCAEIDSQETYGAKGYFAMQISSGRATYSYRVDLTKFSMQNQICDLSQGMYYHIHSYWVNSNNSAAGATLCGASNTGGHYDPNLACGYSSASCELLNRTSPSSYKCNHEDYMNGKYQFCQIGDLSGKFGKAMPTSSDLVFQESLLIDYRPPYISNYLQDDSISSMWSSIVFHCSDNTRLLCAKFKVVSGVHWGNCILPDTNLGNSLSSWRRSLLSVKIALIIVSTVFVIGAVCLICMYNSGFIKKNTEYTTV